MRKQFQKLILAAAVIFLTTCGIDEYYYLPQVTSISSSGGVATINLPAISSYWASHYSIFYRIYISSSNLASVDIPSSFSSINSSLLSDWNSLFNVSSQTNTSAIPNVNTFRNISYYEMEFAIGKLPITGGSIEIPFPTGVGDIPFLSLNGTSVTMLRSSDFSPQPDRNSTAYPYFQNYSASMTYYDGTTRYYSDVASGSGGNTYVSMYIVAVGRNPDTFQTLYGKPSHIDVFLLPNAN